MSLQKEGIEITTIFSESPEKDMWRELLQFTYEANIKRYLQKQSMDADEETLNCIIGSFLQSHAYYKAAKESNLQIAPLLLYYGSVNLIYGMVNLLNGHIIKIANHGMVISIPKDMHFISDTHVKFLSPNDGGVHVAARALGFNVDLTGFGDWKLSEFLDSIAEINEDYIQCYDVQVGRVIMLDCFNTPDGPLEKVYFSDKNKKSIDELLSDVEDFNTSYLRPVTAKGDQGKNDYLILRHKLNGKDISQISYSGQPYLIAGHEKGNRLVTIPTLLNMYISLFILASLCRYYPERWSPFVLQDTTGEKLLIEKFLYYSRRLIPNFVLNKIWNDQIQYSTTKYNTINAVKSVSEHQVQELVDQKIKEQMGNLYSPFNAL